MLSKWVLVLGDSKQGGAVPQLLFLVLSDAVHCTLYRRQRVALVSMSQHGKPTNPSVQLIFPLSLKEEVKRPGAALLARPSSPPRVTWWGLAGGAETALN